MFLFGLELYLLWIEIVLFLQGRRFTDNRKLSVVSAIKIKKARFCKNGRNILAPQRGLEPRTWWLTATRSTD
jgi:hypothetical protein